MGDGKPDGKGAKKPGKGKRPKKPQVDGAPRDLDDFLDCKADKVELKPGKIGWIPKKGIFEYAPEPEVSFAPGKAAGTVDITLKLGLSTTFTAKVVDGRLSVDVSDSTLLSTQKDAIDKFARDLNDWFAAKGKKLGAPTVKDGAVVLTKEATAAAAPGGVKKRVGLDPFPHAPAWEKGAAVGVLALATVVGVAAVPGTEKTTVTETYTAERPVETPAPTPAPTPAATAAPTTTTSEPAPTELAVLDGCFELEHGAGESYITLHITANRRVSGPWNAWFQNAPAGPEQGRGTITDGQGEIDFTIFQYGARDGLQIWGPDNQPVDVGPLAGLLPFEVGPDERTCDASTLQTVPLPGAATTSPGTEPTTTSTATGAETETVTLERPVRVNTDTPPWSLLLIPGTALAAYGVLQLDELRRRRLDEGAPGGPYDQAQADALLDEAGFPRPDP